MANHPTRPRWVTTESERKIIQLMGATGTRCTGCGFEASNRKSLKKHVTTHVYVYICRCGFSSYWLYSVQKHAKACLITDNIAYRVDADSFHDWKVSCGCSLEENPGLWPTSAKNSHHYLKGWGREDMWKTDIENTKQTWIERIWRRLKGE